MTKKKGKWAKFLESLFAVVDKTTFHNVDKERKFWLRAYRNQDKLWSHANENAGRAPGIRDCSDL